MQCRDDCISSIIEIGRRRTREKLESMGTIGNIILKLRKEKINYLLTYGDTRELD